MRIISGELKGKKIELPKDKLTRPLRDMVKESIFNIILHSQIINFKLEDCIVLDLFSGSGSFGLECISRGVKHVHFYENYLGALEVLKKNIDNLKCKDQCTIIEKSCFELDKYFKKSANIIFLDPPFKEVKINHLLELILEKNFLDKDGIIIIHRKKNNHEDFLDKFKVLETRNYGVSKIIFGTRF